MAESPIRKDIEAYLTSARRLEEDRKRIDTLLRQFLVEDIIPSVVGHLPDGYQIDPQKSRVYYTSPQQFQRVPTEIQVLLRLKYDNEDIISWHEDGRELIDNARKALELILEELSNSYGVAVSVGGKLPRM